MSDNNGLRAALANAHNSLELYHAYGWPDRGGVRAALRVQIDALVAAQQPANDLRAIGWLRPDGSIHKGCPPFGEPHGWVPVYVPVQQPADITDLDRVLRLADEHAEDSHEDGTRVLDRGGLLAFAKDVLRIFGAAPSAPEQTSAAVEAVAEVYHIQHAGLDDDSYATIRLLHRASDQWGLRLRAKSLLYTAPPEPLRVGALTGLLNDGAEKIAVEAFKHALAGGNLFDLYALPLRSQLRQSLASAQPTSAAADVDALAQFIRSIDGRNSMGAGVLAEHICEWLATTPEGKP